MDVAVMGVVVMWLETAAILVGSSGGVFEAIVTKDRADFLEKSRAYGCVEYSSSERLSVMVLLKRDLLSRENVRVARTQAGRRIGAALRM